MPSTYEDREDRTADVVQAIQFHAQLRHAEQECSDEVLALIQPLYEIVADPNATEEEKEHAALVIADAIVPGLTFDFRCNFAASLREVSAREIEREVIAEEGAFADRVKLELATRGMTQQDLAQRLGVNQSAISMLLNRKGRPQMKTVHKIAAAFGMKPEELWPTIAK